MGRTNWGVRGRGQLEEKGEGRRTHIHHGGRVSLEVGGDLESLIGAIDLESQSVVIDLATEEAEDPKRDKSTEEETTDDTDAE